MKKYNFHCLLSIDEGGLEWLETWAMSDDIMQDLLTHMASQPTSLPPSVLSSLFLKGGTVSRDSDYMKWCCGRYYSMPYSTQTSHPLDQFIVYLQLIEINHSFIRAVLNSSCIILIIHSLLVSSYPYIFSCS